MDSDAYERVQRIDFSRLRPADALVPTNALFLPWHSSRMQNGLSESPHGREELLGDNIILNAYMRCSGMRTLHPHSQVPIGVLLLLYNTVFSPDHATTGDHPVTQHARGQGLVVTEPDDLVPFAIVLGRDVIEYTLNNQ